MSSPFDGLPDIFVGTFGQAVTLITTVGEVVQAEGIFQTRSVDALGMIQPGATLHMRGEDAAKIEDGNLVQIGGEWFSARAADPDGKGMVPFRLEASNGP